MRRFKIPSRPYSDWFGEGNLKDDLEEAIQLNGEPISIIIEKQDENEDGYYGWMGCLIYPDKVIVVGYDGSEYKHKFIFTEKLK